MTHLPNRPVTRSGPAAGPADGGVPLHPERVAPTAFEPSAPPASAMAWSDLDALANAPSFGPTAVGPVPTGSAGPSAAESGDGRSQVRLRLGILAAAGPTLRDELAHIAPGTCWQELGRWPPDAFAATSTILASGAIACAHCKSRLVSKAQPAGEPLTLLLKGGVPFG